LLRPNAIPAGLYIHIGIELKGLSPCASLQIVLVAVGARASKHIAAADNWTMRSTILVVDDSSLSRSVIKVYLMNHDLEFLEAANGEEALRLLEHRSVDLIISDLNMPRMDGLQLARLIRHHPQPRVRAIPLVLLTATTSHEQALRDAHRAGASDFVRKPVSSGNLVEVVKKYLWPSSTSEKVVSPPRLLH
jgi:CheY-like chemotaxis protein